MRLGFLGSVAKGERWKLISDLNALPKTFLSMDGLSTISVSKHEIFLTAFSIT